MEQSQGNIGPEIVIRQGSAKSEDLPNNVEMKEVQYRKESSKSVTAIKCAKPKIFFNDGIRSVDFVLVWDDLDEESTKQEAYDKRKIFEENLIKEGLEIEREQREQNGLCFIKVERKDKITS